MSRPYHEFDKSFDVPEKNLAADLRIECDPTSRDYYVVLDDQNRWLYRTDKYSDAEEFVRGGKNPCSPTAWTMDDSSKNPAAIALDKPGTELQFKNLVLRSHKEIFDEIRQVISGWPHDCGPIAGTRSNTDICKRCQIEKELPNPHAQALGKLGGASKSTAKKRASKKNGRKGGRPKKTVDKEGR